MDADVVVIGAGALGLSTALHCALAGRSVIVLDRYQAGSQASGRAAGLILAYAAAARRHGAEVAGNEPVTGIEVTGGRVRAVETGRRRLTAGAVVDAAGAWVAQVASLAGGDVPVAPVRHQLLITGP